MSVAPAPSYLTTARMNGLYGSQIRLWAGSRTGKRSVAPGSVSGLYFTVFGVRTYGMLQSWTSFSAYDSDTRQKLVPALRVAGEARDAGAVHLIIPQNRAAETRTAVDFHALAAAEGNTVLLEHGKIYDAYAGKWCAYARRKPENPVAFFVSIRRESGGRMPGDETLMLFTRLQWRMFASMLSGVAEAAGD